MGRCRQVAVFAALLALVACGSQGHDASPIPPPTLIPGTATARFPYGVYAYFTFPRLTENGGPYPLASLNDDFGIVLGSPATSGLAIEVGWDQLNPNAPGADATTPAAFCTNTSPPAAGESYDWRIYDAAFCQVETWNRSHPLDPPKTIELMVAPGFNTPAWALKQIPGTCDPLFDGETPSEVPCGQATFLDSEGTVTPALRPLPLPWNPVYQGLWKAFLQALAGRYGTEAPLVATAVAGPTAQTYEILLPGASIPSNAREADGASPAFSIPRSQTQMWATLLTSPSSNPQGVALATAPSDQPLVDAWSAAIDMYDSVFSGLTLIVSTGNQLPNLSGGTFAPAGAPGGPPSSLDFSPDCAAANDSMDCAAETQIEAHLLALTTRNDNLKATMTSGMSRARWNDYLGLQGVKLLSLAYPGRILGGAELNTEFNERPVTEGCQVPIPPPIGEVYDRAHCTTSMLASCTSDDCDLPVACIPAACVVEPISPSQYDAGLYELTPEPPKPGETQYVISPEQALYNVLQEFFDRTAAAAYYGAPGYRDGTYAEASGATPMNYLLVYYKDIEYAALGVADAGPALAAVALGDGGTVTASAQDELNTARRQIGQIANPLPPEPVR